MTAVQRGVAELSKRGAFDPIHHFLAMLGLLVSNQGLFAALCEKIGDLKKESFATRGSIIFPPKVAKRPPWQVVSGHHG